MHLKARKKNISTYIKGSFCQENRVIPVAIFKIISTQIFFLMGSNYYLTELNVFFPLNQQNLYSR